MKKKLLSLILITTILMGVVSSGVSATISQQYVESNTNLSLTNLTPCATRLSINQLRTKFPQGKYWNHKVTAASNNGDNLMATWNESYADSVTSYPCATHSGPASVGQYDCNFFDGGIQCFGFAYKLGYDYSGVRPSTWSVQYSLNNIQVGDIIRYNNHSVFVIAVSSSGVSVAEGNYAYNCYINWDRYMAFSQIINLEWVRKCPVGPPTPSTKPGKPALSNFKTSYKSNETITFKWSSTTNTTHYNLYIDRRKSDGTWESNYKYWHYATSGFSTTLPDGIYRACIQSTNSNVSGWPYTDGDYIKFSVGDTPTNVTLTADKTTFNLGETVTFTPSAQNWTYFNFRVDNEKGESVKGLTSLKGDFTWKPESKGVFYAYVAAWNVSGYTMSSKVKITVTANMPSDIKGEIEKTSYKIDEDVTFTFSGKNVTRYYVNLYRDNVMVRLGATTTNQITIQDLEAGVYSYEVMGYNPSGQTTVKSNTKFIVQPQKINPSSEKTVSVSGLSLPSVARAQGLAFQCGGTVTSKSDIESVSVGVYSGTGQFVTGETMTYSSGVRTYNLSNFTGSVKMENLSTGSYFYNVRVKNASGTTEVVRHMFFVYTANGMKLSAPTVSLDTSVMKTGDIVSVQWKAIDGATSYFVNLEKSPYGTNNIIQNGTTKDTYYSFCVDEPGEYKISVIPRDGDHHYYGPQSNQASLSVVDDIDISGYKPVASTTYNGNIYELYDDGVSWRVANNIAKKMGGNLVTITSSGENTVVANLLKDGTKTAYWLGGSNFCNINNTFTWTTMEAFSQYSNWANDEPSGGMEHFLEMYASDGTWNDTVIYGVHYKPENMGFVIEKNGEIPVTGVTVSPTSVNLTKGETVTLQATITPADAGNKGVTWKSSPKDVATVDENGKVTALKEGTAIITVTTNNGSKTATCTVKIGHTLLMHIAKDATCFETGNTVYWSCIDCNHYFADADGKTEINENSWVISKKAHTLLKFEAHEPTCTTSGNITFWICSGCTKFFSDEEGNNEIPEGSWVIPAGHKLTGHVAKAATCTTAGNTAYWSCSGCTKYFSDSEGKTEIKANSWNIAALGHSWDSGVITKAATTSEAGVKTYTCTRCKTTKTETIPKLNPTPTPTPTPVPTVSFSDVKASDYFFTPVSWAVANGVTNGIGNGLFGPNQTCTRGQIVTFLWRAAGCPEPKSSYNPFNDVKPSDYFYKAVLWAVENNITSGMSANSFGSNLGCTRGQVVTFLWRANGKPAVSGSNPFTDVKTSDYYYNAVLWAVQQGITKGMDATHFAPNNTCVRGQIVTFLYRYYN